MCVTEETTNTKAPPTRARAIKRRTDRLRRPHAHAARYAMPVAVADLDGTPVRVLFPKRADASSEWTWPEIESALSPVDGFGLFPRESASFSWRNTSESPLYIPILGRESEFTSDAEAEIFRYILRGHFVPLPATEIHRAPQGHEWRTNGVYVEVVPASEVPNGWRELDPGLTLLQVMLNDVTTPSEAGSCVYVVKDAAARLLHIPSSILAVLERHHRQHHNDRHFASHLVSYRNGPRVHMLVNAHPIFGETAYAAGCVNEPRPDEPANMELVLEHLKVCSEDEQPHPSLINEWTDFADEFPEVLGRHIYFMTLKTQYNPGEEFLCNYGPAYERSYTVSTSPERNSITAISNKSQPPSVPRDVFRQSDMIAARWPHRVPAWWNVAIQPMNRPAFCNINSQDGSSAAESFVTDDDPDLVLRRRSELGRSGSAAACTPARSVGSQIKDHTPPAPKRQCCIQWRTCVQTHPPAQSPQS